MNFKRTFLSLALLVIICGLAAKPAAADSVLYDSALLGVQDNLSLVASGSNWAAPSFTLASASTISGFDFAVGTLGNPLAQYNWAITNAPNGTPIASGTVLNPAQQFEGAIVLGRTGDAYVPTAADPGYTNGSWGPVFQITSPTGLDIGLDAGTYYFELAQAESTQTAPGQYTDVMWMGLYTPNTLTTTSSGAKGYTPSFQILGSEGVLPNGGGSGLPSSVVPEPPSVTLLGLGLLGLFAATKFRISKPGEAAESGMPA